MYLAGIAELKVHKGFLMHIIRIDMDKEMLYKITSFVFMALFAIFASLYFVEKSSGELPKESSLNVKAKEQSPIRIREAKAVEQKTDKLEVQTKTVVLTKEVSSHPGISREDFNLMVEVKNSMSRDYSRRLEREHPLLFERLQMDEAQKNEFKLLIGERRLGLNLRPLEDASEEAKEEYQLKKDEILESIDNKIAEVLGEQTESYFNYRDKAQQYQVVSSINSKLTSSGEQLEIDQQDQLADLMHISRKQSDEQNGKVDWRSLRESPDKAVEALTQYKERHELMKAEIGFLSDVQKDIFVKHLDSRYKRYESWVKKLNREKR